VAVDDGDPCTSDSCDQIGGVRHTPVTAGTSCADETVCNGSEVCLPPNAATCSPLAGDAVAWWPGDGNAKEVIAGQDGTLQGGVSFVNAQVNKGFSFDGVDDAVDVSAHAAALNLAGQATIEMWVMTTNDNCRTLFELEQDSTHKFMLQVGANCTSLSTNELVTWTYVNGANTTVSVFGTGTRSTLIGPIRRHLALTFDGAGNTALYIDGASRGVITTGVDGGIWGDFANPVVATIGAQPAVDHFTGVIDELTIYARALSGTEIKAIFDAKANGKCKPPVCQPGTNAASGTSCEDGGTCDGAGMCVGP
jgi:hypothetical protein